MFNHQSFQSPYLIVLFRSIIIFLALFFYFSSNAQTQYYVKTDGNNANDGLSINNAWQSIQYAADNVPAGQAAVVNILGGNYAEKINITVSGAPNQYITFKNYDNVAVIIHNSAGLGGQDALIRINNQSYIILEGLNLTDNQRIDAQGILVEGTSHHIEIRNNFISEINFSTNPNQNPNENRNSQPIIVYGNHPNTAITDLIIDGNTVMFSRTGYSEALAVNGNVDGFEVTNNVVRDVTNIGIDIIGHEGTSSNPTTDQARNGLVKGNTTFNCQSPYATAAGIYVDGGKDLVIENNMVYQNQWGIEVGCENVGKTTSGIIIRNNFIYNNDNAAIAMGGFDFPGGSGKVVDCTFINNTCFHNDLINDFTGEFFLMYTENCSFRNNIFYADNSHDVMLYLDVAPNNLTFDYNLFYAPSGANNIEFSWHNNNYSSFSDYQNGTGNDANSIFIDPDFESANITNPDLHISTTSPAIDSGDPNFMADMNETDIDGNARVVMGRVDIGADEIGTPLASSYIEPLTAIVHPHQVELRWQTAPALSMDFFVIEKSRNSQHWTKIGSLNRKEIPSYRFFDTEPLLGISYYRLSQIAQNGEVTVSHTVAITYEKVLPFEVYPNPMSDILTITPNELHTDKLHLQLIDIAGKVVLEQAIWANEPIDVSAFEAGVYCLKIRDKNAIFIQKVIK